MKITWDNIDAKAVEKLENEIEKLIEKRCEKDCDGDLPVAFRLRSRKHSYPWTDVFLIDQDDRADMDRIIEEAAANASEAVGRLNMLIRLKGMHRRDAERKKK